MKFLKSSKGAVDVHHVRVHDQQVSSNLLKNSSTSARPSVPGRRSPRAVHPPRRCRNHLLHHLQVVHLRLADRLHPHHHLRLHVHLLHDRVLLDEGPHSDSASRWFTPCFLNLRKGGFLCVFVDVDPFPLPLAVWEKRRLLSSRLASPYVRRSAVRIPTSSGRYAGQNATN